MENFWMFLILMMPSVMGLAQDEEEINVAGVRFLNYGSQLPENLLSSKSVVLLQVPSENRNSAIRGDWKPLAEKAHEIFKRVGIDPVAYYLMEDVLSGYEVSRAFAEALMAREVKNLVIISDLFVRINNKEQERFVVMVTPFNGEHTLMSNGQKAWKNQNKNLDKALDNFRRAAARRRLERTNLLISDYPELFRDIALIRGRRFETYSNGLSSEKVAFTKFPLATIPDDRPGGLLNNRIAKEAESSNQSVARDNKQLAALLGQYPFEFGLVDSIPDEQALINQQYQYVIFPLHTYGMSVKYLLDYNIEEGSSDFITIKQNGGQTILRNIPTEAPVYKFYIKHLKTQDVFVGSRWDADETWEEALKNFISNIRKDFDVR